ncbi:DUF1097 domain-containing protein [Propionispira raffinosivorans]|uniref:DUF1097 domain-containing protein n=1 Tax=Propionispira raffinosivorans TaxID=86959 RepID=UPI00036A1D86|nr:DUF1097 domain-containing protein [Propionispira raffinosivorans]
MNKINSLDISVAALAAVSCLGALAGLPIWALFIGWAWYFTLGATVAGFKQAIPPMLAGSMLAVLAIVLIDSLSGMLSPLGAMIFAVFITVFLLMLTLKIKGLDCSLASFNSYSCMFAGYYAASFPVQPVYVYNLGYAVLWITGANFLGLVFGWLSIKLAGLGKTASE